MGNRWLNGPIKIPIYFDPDEAFVEQKNIAIGIMEDIYNLFAQIKITVKDLKRIDQYNKLYGRLDSKRVMILAKLQDLCGQLASYRETIWRIHSDSKNRVNPYFPAFDYSSDWDEKYIIFKYIARYGGHEPVQYLYNLMGDDPYLPLIKSFMPADAVGRFF
jgi:ubiquitin